MRNGLGICLCTRIVNWKVYNYHTLFLIVICIWEENKRTKPLFLRANNTNGTKICERSDDQTS